MRTTQLLTARGPIRTPLGLPDAPDQEHVGWAIEASKDPAGRAGAIKRIADQLDVHPEALRGSVKRAEIDEGVVPGTTSAEAARIAELEREVKELRRANAILKSAPRSRPMNQIGRDLVNSWRAPAR
ncbi:transposase [Streptomyces parvus]|uniref:Transposase n=1 Tax=Streptomyces parvus TaxID=66428 RepID=A0A5D4IU15_9ACTN|nr:transposase [Streptomyces parvus]